MPAPATIKDQAIAIIEIGNAICEVIEASPNGCPGGSLYAALMSGMSLETFQGFMDLLVQSGRIKRTGHLYFKSGTPVEAYAKKLDI